MTPHSSTAINQHSLNRGLSLIELLVAMAIGLVVTLAITAILINSERVKLTSTKLNSASQTGAFSSLVLDREIRNAGSGFTQSRSALGCLLNASRANPIPQQLLPPPAAPLPHPFDTIAAGTPIRLAPAVIVDGAGVGGSDHIVVMSGSHGFGETPRGVSPGSTTAFSTVVDSPVGMAGGDLILISRADADPDNPAAPGTPCMIQQHGAPVGQSLPMAGPYFVAAGTNVNLANFATETGVTVSSLGRIDPGINNPHSFRIYGVGNNNILFSYDLLNTAGAANPDSEAIAEGVFAMHALYGVGTRTVSFNDTSQVQGARVPLTWRAPTGPLFGIGTLWPPAGTAPLTVQTNVQRRLEEIQAIRIAMVLQSNLQERDPAPGEAPATPATQLVLFPDVPAATVTIPLTPAQQNFRYRIVETIIPIRNM